MAAEQNGNGPEGGARTPNGAPKALRPAGIPGFRHIVAIGGGTGLPAVLRGLKALVFPPGRPPRSSLDRGRLTAIVTVSDDGGSTGRLRRAYGIPAPGDLRNCLVALSDAPALARLFAVRFNGRGDVSGHSLGNLILAALNDLEGEFGRAVERAADILEIRGRVVPCTSAPVRLAAEFDDGRVVEGESEIPMVRRRIRRLTLRPEGIAAHPAAREAIAAADLVVIGPGSLYTSLLPVLLVEDLRHALARSQARVALVMNLMTEAGETDGYRATQCLQAIREHAPEIEIDDVLVNSALLPGERMLRYVAAGSAPIAYEADAIRAFGSRPVECDLLSDGPLLRHDPAKLARALMGLAGADAAEDGWPFQWAAAAERRR
ncbi:MAG TPA: uridine diphosphate-N-acetylglucosamine-binding protein YvcK [Candidatus Polarisedimenticolia bacterium]|jgi:uncharacterized cofD-like protein|nr:uridine diphosphate-N-acetylglucosamine-binding protein YvcK [Candidatus Polarisedimenticolia bacterium]